MAAYCMFTCLFNSASCCEKKQVTTVCRFTVPNKSNCH